MAGESVPLSPEEREARLTLIRKEAQQFGRVEAGGVRPAGAPFPQATPETGYYGVPLLKEPQWKWEIPLYFFVGGAAGSAAVIASVADWLGADPELARDARWVALGGAALSGGLLVADLGRPARFLAMLRVFKPQSPMSMGAWILSAFSSATAAAAFTSWARNRYGESLPLAMVDEGAKAMSALFGLPFSNYTGVLIGATAIPVWNRNIRTLPVHFGASGVQAGVSILELLGHDHPALNALAIGSAAWESWEGFHLERRSDPQLDPLKHGTSGWITRAGGVLSGPIPLILRSIPAVRGDSRMRRAASYCGIAGSLLTRYGWMMAGKVSAKRTTAGAEGADEKRS
jgi:hypothetical protein